MKPLFNEVPLCFWVLRRAASTMLFPRSAVERIWHIQDSQCQIMALPSQSSHEHYSVPFQVVPGKSPRNILGCSFFALKWLMYLFNIAPIAPLACRWCLLLPRFRAQREHLKIFKNLDLEAPAFAVLCVPYHKRPFVGVSQGTVLGFGDGFGAILRGTVSKS